MMIDAIIITFCANQGVIDAMGRERHKKASELRTIVYGIQTLFKKAIQMRK